MQTLDVTPTQQIYCNYCQWQFAHYHKKYGSCIVYETYRQGGTNYLEKCPCYACLVKPMCHCTCIEKTVFVKDFRELVFVDWRSESDRHNSILGIHFIET